MYAGKHWSDFQNREVDTYVVNARAIDPLHKSVQHAIDNAQPFDRVALVTGEYVDIVTVTKPIELVADDGEVAEIVTQGPTIVVSGDFHVWMSRVNFRVKHIRGTQSEDPPAVLLSAGKIQMTYCAMTSLCVTGTAKVDVTQCQIERNVLGCGITVKDRATGYFAHNVVKNHSLYCLYVSSYGSPVFEYNVFQSGDIMGDGLVYICGVYHGAETAPDLKSNKVLGKPFGDDKPRTDRAPQDVADDFSCIAITHGAAPVLTDNEISGMNIGLSASACGGIVRGNHFSKSTSFAIVTTDESTLLFETNDVKECANGMLIGDASCQMTRNTISQCIGVGLELRGVRGAEMKGNTIFGNNSGVFIGPGCTGLMVENSIHHNNEEGVLMFGVANRIHLVGNKITGNKTVGVLCDEFCEPEFEDNDISFNQGYGLKVCGGSFPELHRCKFEENQLGNVKFANRGKGHMEKCEILGGVPAQVVISTGAKPTLVNNNISHSTGTGILVKNRGLGEFRENIISGNRVGVMVCHGGDPYFSASNKIRANIQFGVYVAEGGLGVFTNCDFGSNRTHIRVENGSPVFRGNQLDESGLAGVTIESAEPVLVEKCTISRATTEGAVMISGENTRNTIVRNNTITNNKGFGIFTESKAHPDVSRNTISWNDAGGLGSRDCGAGHFHHNEIEHNVGPGLYCDHGSTCEFDNNKIFTTPVGGELRNSSPYVHHNEFQQCTNAALIVFACKDANFVTNDFTGNETGLVVEDDCSNSTFQSLTFYSNHVGLHSRGGNFSIQISIFRDNTTVGVLLEESAPQTAVERCQIQDNVIGIQCYTKDQATIRHCELSSNTTGVELRAEAATRIIDCTITESATGIYGAEAGGGYVEKCTVTDCSYGVDMCGGATTTVTGCTLTDNQDIACRINGCSCVIQECELAGSNVLLQLCGSGGSDAQVFGNKMTRAASCAVLALDTAAATVERNVIWDQPEHAIVLDGSSKARIVANRIFANKGAGVQCRGGTQATVLKNSLDRNGIGIQMAAGCAATVEENQVTMNVEYGVICQQGAGGTLLNNNIFENPRSNVTLERGSAVVLKGNHIHDGVGHNVMATHCECRLIENSIHDCRDGVGVYIEGTGGIRLENNTIFENMYGVRMVTDSTATLLDNDFWGNFKMNLLVECDAVPKASGNKFRISRIGVLLDGDARGELVKNEFMENDVGLTFGGCPVHTNVVENTFSGNKRCGIVISHENQKICGNRFDSVAVGIDIESGGNHFEVSNCVFNGGQVGIKISDGVEQGEVSSCHFAGLGIGLRHLTDSKELLLTSSCFEKNTVGVAIENGEPSVYYNCFLGNQCGLSTENPSTNPNVDSNVFSDNVVGVKTAFEGRGIFACNDYHQNEVAIRTEETGKGFFFLSIIHDNGIGILCASGSTPEVERCSVFSNRTADCCTEHGGNPTVTKCNFPKSSTAFVLRDGGNGRFANNTITKATTTAVLFHNAGDSGVVTSNTVTGCATAVTLTGGGGGTFSGNDVEDCATGCHSHSSGGGEVRTNVFTGGDTGIICEDDGQTVFRGNLFTKSSRAGMMIKAGAAGTFIENDVVEAGPVGITIQGVDSRGTFQSNRVKGMKTGIFFGPQSASVFEGNYVSTCEVGATVTPESKATLTGNTIYNNKKTGIVIVSGQIKFTGNTVSTQHEAGAVECKGHLNVSSTNVIRHQFTANYSLPDPVARPKIEWGSTQLDKDDRRINDELCRMHQGCIPHQFYRAGCSAIKDSDVQVGNEDGGGSKRRPGDRFGPTIEELDEAVRQQAAKDAEKAAAAAAAAQASSPKNKLKDAAKRAGKSVRRKTVFKRKQTLAVSSPTSESNSALTFSLTSPVLVDQASDDSSRYDEDGSDVASPTMSPRRLSSSSAINDDDGDGSSRGSNAGYSDEEEGFPENAEEGLGGSSRKGKRRKSKKQKGGSVRRGKSVRGSSADALEFSDRAAASFGKRGSDESTRPFGDRAGSISFMDSVDAAGGNDGPSPRGARSLSIARSEDGSILAMLSLTGPQGDEEAHEGSASGDAKEDDVDVELQLPDMRRRSDGTTRSSLTWSASSAASGESGVDRATHSTSVGSASGSRFGSGSGSGSLATGAASNLEQPRTAAAVEAQKDAHVAVVTLGSSPHVVRRGGGARRKHAPSTSATKHVVSGMISGLIRPAPPGQPPQQQQQQQPVQQQQQRQQQPAHQQQQQPATRGALMRPSYGSGATSMIKPQPSLLSDPYARKGPSATPSPTLVTPRAAITSEPPSAPPSAITSGLTTPGLRTPATRPATKQSNKHQKGFAFALPVIKTDAQPTGAHTPRSGMASVMSFAGDDRTPEPRQQQQQQRRAMMTPLEKPRAPAMAPTGTTSLGPNIGTAPQRPVGLLGVAADGTTMPPLPALATDVAGVTRGVKVQPPQDPSAPVASALNTVAGATIQIPVAVPSNDREHASTTVYSQEQATLTPTKPPGAVLNAPRPSTHQGQRTPTTTVAVATSGQLSSASDVEGRVANLAYDGTTDALWAVSALPLTVYQFPLDSPIKHRRTSRGPDPLRLLGRLQPEGAMTRYIPFIASDSGQCAVQGEGDAADVVECLDVACKPFSSPPEAGPSPLRSGQKVRRRHKQKAAPVEEGGDASDPQLELPPSAIKSQGSDNALTQEAKKRSVRFSVHHA